MHSNTTVFILYFFLKTVEMIFKRENGSERERERERESVDDEINYF